ncbi:hypothetical protein PLA106_07190, partial [Pseudomonas amygdali pv. lachrymans str. M302278]
MRRLSYTEGVVTRHSNALGLLKSATGKPSSTRRSMVGHLGS